MQNVWSFDIGTGSFGIAVRQRAGSRHEFREVSSLLIPDEFASIRPAASRRRSARTREAHQAREGWLRECFTNAGLSDAVLVGRKPVREKGQWVTLTGDYRLEREFPPKLNQRTKDGAPNDLVGSQICYCGAVLRMKLIHGENLAPWQIYKALHSAIQKRGYDPDVPWKNKTRGDSRKVSEGDEDGVTLQRANDAEKALQQLHPDSRYQLPCYLEASKMRLWDANDPTNTTALRPSYDSEPARGAIYFRSTVERELRLLLGAAEKLLPALQGQMDFILYGPSGKSYASYDPDLRAEHGLIQGKEADWQGILAQKVPTFDNRALTPCALISRFHATKAAPHVQPIGTDRLTKYKLEEASLLPAEVTFLMKLKHFRFAVPGGDTAGFTAAQINNVFELKRQELTTKLEAKPTTKAKTKNLQDAEMSLESDANAESISRRLVDTFHLTEKQLSKAVESAGGCALLPNQKIIESPKASGRSRFSKPALGIVKRLILSGRSPSEVLALEKAALNGNTNPKKGLVEDDLKFLVNTTARGGGEATWANFYIADESLSFLDQAGETRQQKINALIGRQIDPIVRHRLATFSRILTDLESRHGKPDHVVVEFVREDFMGAKAKLELADFQKKRREARAQARKETGEGKGDMLKMQLLKDQGGVCLYCGTQMGAHDLAHAQTDHIVPRESGGPDAYWNFVVACQACNNSTDLNAKGKRTPYDWFRQTNRPGWDAYAERVRKQTYTLRPKKARLLLDADAVAQVERYQNLAETAWIAKLAREVICLHFGWDRKFTDGIVRVVVLPGGLTARVRRKYQLNSLLGQDIRELEAKLVAEGDAKIEAEIEKKCRADKRHHALDAMVLSFLPQWSNNPGKRVFVGLPAKDGVHREFFERYLAEVVPTNLCFEPAKLEETAYGQRMKPHTDKPVATKRFELKKLGYTGIKPVFKLDTLQKHVAGIMDDNIRKAIQDFITDTEPAEEDWQNFCEGFRQPSAKGPGALVKLVRRIVSEDLSEYKDLSKGDKRPSLYKGEKHQGFFVYMTDDSKVKVQRALAFDSLQQVRQHLNQRLGKDVTEIFGFFTSGCAVTIEREIPHTKTPLPPGRYKFNTIQNGRSMIVTSSTGVISSAISVTAFVHSGLRRV